MNQYIQKENCEATELDGEWIVLNVTQCTITKLNDVGGHCWSLLKEAQNAETLTKSLLEKFSAIEDTHQVRKEIDEFLNNLVQYGLIDHVD
jgi:hypothetical protein